jgi:hypothetical protein
MARRLRRFVLPAGSEAFNLAESNEHHAQPGRQKEALIAQAHQDAKILKKVNRAKARKRKKQNVELAGTTQSEHTCDRSSDDRADPLVPEQR